MEARTRDYSSIGLNLVWIFHQHLFRGMASKSLQQQRKKSILFFTDINSQGFGTIYDLYTIQRGIFIKKYFLPVDLSKPILWSDRLLIKYLPEQLSGRSSLPFYFTGDAIDLLSKQKLTLPPQPNQWDMQEKKRSFLRWLSK